MWLMTVYSVTFVIVAWIFFFFVFDETILKGYFKRKLQKHFKVEE